MRNDFRQHVMFPAVRNWVCGTLDYARNNGFDDFYRVPVTSLEAFLEDQYFLPPAEARRLIKLALGDGLCLRGWRFALSPYFQNGQRLMIAQRLHS